MPRPPNTTTGFWLLIPTTSLQPSRVGRLAVNSGKPQDSLDPLNRALSLSVQLDNQEQKAATLQHMGEAYRMLNKPEEALRNSQEALAIRRQLGQKNGIASSLNGIARIQAGLGKNKDALANFQEALTDST